MLLARVRAVRWIVPLSCLSLVLAASRSQAQSPVSTARITVDAHQSVGPVNRYVFGHCVEAADSAGVFKGAVTNLYALHSGSGYWNPVARQPVASVLRECHELGLSMLRYPGGSLANNYDWRKSVGPLASRGEWKFGLDEYLELCRQLGAEPLITASDYVLPADQMPKHNAELVEYLNAPATPEHPWAMKRKAYGHPEPYGVKWFELGNESNGGNTDVQPHRQYSAEEYARYAMDCTREMKAVDPSIKVGLVTAIIVQDPYCDWNQKVVRLAGPTADFVIVHEYAPAASPTMPPDQEGMLMRACMATGDQYEKMLGDYHGMIKKSLGKDLPLAITEYNGGGESNEPKPYRFTYGVALECADLLRIFLKPENNVFAANYWQLVNGYFGGITTDLDQPDGGKLTERAMPPLYRLWGEHFGASLLATKADAPTASFEGMGGTLPAKGKNYQTAGSLGPTGIVPTKERASLTGPGYAIEWTGDDSFTATLTNFTNEAYPLLGTVKPSTGKNTSDCDYHLTFEARYLPDTSVAGTETVPLGLELVDARGWNATGSIAQVRGVGQTEWKPFSSESFHTLGDAKAVTLNAIFGVGAHKVAGRLEVRNLKVEALGKTTFPEYALITCSASLSAKQDTLYLMVFNKSDTRNILTHVNIASFPAASAKFWQVNAAELNVLEGVKEVVSGEQLPCATNGFDYEFPAHSMTAIELHR